MRKELIEKYLMKESTYYYGPNFIAGDDDFPTGNILMGDKYKKVDYYNRLTSFNKKWVPDTDKWTWDDFGAASGQESLDAYHDSLKKSHDLGIGLSTRLFKHMTNKPPVEVPRELRALGNDIFTDADSWGNKGVDYTMTADDPDTIKTKDGGTETPPPALTYFDRVKRNVNKYINKNKKAGIKWH